MGVRGLQFYLEKCCRSACHEVSIADLVEEHRRKSDSPDEELVIVVDGSSCIRHLYGSDLEWIGGGQLKQFGDKAKFFVNQFAKLGVRLVFFFDGPTVEEKRSTWVERRLSKLEDMYVVLDAIENGAESHSINRKKYFILPPGMGQLSRVIFEVICECKVYQSLVECDEEIANYARRNRVFAILAQDSDFVIYDKGEAWYLSMEKLNLESMSTLIYDHRELARSLRIPARQLPLLATLMGNDIINFKDIKDFHIRMMRRRFPSQHIDFKILVPNLAFYIRTLPTDRDLLYDRTFELSNHLYGNPDRAEDVWTSLQSYSSSQDDRRQPQTHWGRLVSKAEFRHQHNEVPSMVYAIMSGLPFESSTSIEDFRKHDLPSFAEATEPIRKRIYGILLQEKPLERGEREHYVPEWCMAGPHSLDQVNNVVATPPRRRHPGLLTLWGNRNDEETVQVRWQLFVHSVCPHLNVDRIRNLPPNLVIPTLILSYLNELQCLEEWEIDAMLATAVCMPHYSVQMLAALPADPLTTRGIRVANLIMRSTFVLYFLQAVVGYPLSVAETAPWLFFDGKLFQFKYNEAKTRSEHDMLCNHRIDSLESFLTARRLVLGQN